MDKIRMTVEELPELETEVAISGSVKQQEVGGARLPRRRRRDRRLPRHAPKHGGRLTPGAFLPPSATATRSLPGRVAVAALSNFGTIAC